ncbi:DUF2922 domain-containing protein [Shouchella shacheensis]|uniref:DUF2922 domain-containing protein n=1 Tax=Shouchella shacheensis TaxID=1649580 RepID=UPI00073FA9A6|nr:DUF2922 domain-containing protein [Shouchella shacheensis]
MDQTLELRFRTDMGQTVTIRVPEPKPELTAEVIGEAMDVLMATPVFSGNAGLIQTKLDARIVSRAIETIELENE